jgi:hypothetical protein
MPVSALTRLSIAALLALATAMPAVAQTEATNDTKQAKKKAPGRVFAKTPLLRMWFKIDETAAANYMTDLMKEYEFESEFVTSSLNSGLKMASKEPDLQGMMVFMAKGLIPAAVQMTFRTVEDESEFKDMIFKVKTQMAGAAKMSGSGDHYVLDLDFSQGIPVPGETDENGDPKMISFPGMDQLENTPGGLESLRQTIHFRLIDNVMWQGEMPEIMDFKFPTYDQLQPKRSVAGYDVFGEFNISEVPGYVKQILFSAVNVAANSQLQQRDDEDQLVYDSRRANGDMWLELLRTVVYDVDKGRFSVQLADEEAGKPIRVRLDLDARSESNLAKVGRTISNTGTRFGAVRDRKAPMTLATTWGMPEQAKKLFLSALALAQREWQATFADREEELTAADRMSELLSDTLNAGRSDMLFQLTGNVLTGFAVVGGVRLENAAEFRDALDQLISNSADLERVEHTEDDEGRKYVSIGTGEVPIPGTDGVPFDSSVNFTAYDSALWFSYGGPSAQALLEDTIAFAEENRGAETRRATTFQFAFDLSEWMEGDDDVEGFNQYPRQTLITAERQIDKGLASMRVMLSGGNASDMENVEIPARPSFIEKALKRGGDEIDLKLKVTKEGVDLDLNIGLGIANMLVARMIDAQGQIMDAMMSNNSGKFDIPGQQSGPPAPMMKEVKP